MSRLSVTDSQTTDAELALVGALLFFRAPDVAESHGLDELKARVLASGICSEEEIDDVASALSP